MSSVLMLLTLPLVADPAQPDWRALVQEPNARLAVPDLGLKPLLVGTDGRTIKTAAEWPKARHALLTAWQARLGTAPAKPADLAARVEKTEDLDGYRRHLVSFATEGDDRIRAWLLTPTAIKLGEKRPAVVVFHETTRHTFNQPVGLGDVPDYAIGLHLVRRGYVTLSPECYILKDPKGWARGQAAVLAKRRPGWTGMGKMTFDASRCVDYLETLPSVDASRIGCIGHSLGAKETLYALAFEPRYRAGVFSEGGIGLRMSNWTDVWYLTEKMKDHIPALEHHQVMALAAPRPLLIVAGDSADTVASWAFVKAVLPVYELLGAGDRVGLYNHHKKHTFPPEAQQMAYRWLDHRLKGK
jgi:dienelactone hydrolase